MKTTSVLVLLLLMVVVPFGAFGQKESANLIKNGDFEKFTGDNPDGWDTSNIPGVLTVVSASKSAQSGGKSVKCEVKDFGGSLIAGFICQKNIQTGERGIRLSGQFTMHSTGKDQGVLVLCFTNSNGSTIGTTEEYIDDSGGKFIALTKEFQPPAGCTAVHVRLTVLPDKQSEKLHEGSFVICDNLRLTAIIPPEAPIVQ